MMCSWHFTIREKKSYTFIVYSCHRIQFQCNHTSHHLHPEMMLLTCQAWTERCSAGFSVAVEAYSEQQEVVLGHCSCWLCGSKASGLSGRLRSCSF